jgi:HEAT repeat protein
VNELLSAARRDRLRAIRELSLSPAGAFALRRVLFTDTDAHVRAAAARALGGTDAEAWLIDALGDRAPLVRDTIVRALARCGSSSSWESLRRVIETDSVWWVRRAAVYALGALGGDVAVFTAALGDPFWRVRHAAVRVLAALGAHDPEIRLEMLDAPPSSTLAFLRGTWGPVAVEAPARATAPSALPPALLDPDPAVVTARVPRDREVTPFALVELLCDPHVTLRAAAAKRLAASREIDALTSALDWLEEPRIPHVADTVVNLLDQLGEPALAVAERALALPGRPAAARWAIDWIVASSAETLFGAVLDRLRTDPSPALRRAGVTLADDADLVAWAADPAVLDSCATELHARRAFAELAALDGSTSPRTRALQVDAAARRRDPDLGLVVAALSDVHPGPRAIAARWLARTGRIELPELLADPDPTVREAALSALRTEHVALAPIVAAAIADVDPWVARTAIRALVTLARHPDYTAHDAAFDAIDPGVRAIACELPIVDDRSLAHVLACSADRDEGVRAAANEALEHLEHADARITTLLEQLSGPAKVAAYGWLLRRLDDAAIETARTARLVETDLDVHLFLTRYLVGLGAVEAVLAPAAEVTPVLPIAAPTAPVSVERRAFGRAGFDVAPLAISGAFDLPVEGLQQAVAAGVDLFFWEPGYDLLARFLRTRPQLRVITGTYHADAASIRADVDRALRVLKRDTLDAFLLFWTRSAARVDAAAYAVLDELKRAGKIRAIGFSTHHRELAKEAIEARAWDVVMIRHSAAHPGIERELLPLARERGTAIVTFSALTYGRMTSGDGAPSPAECYRYSLAQPGVTACISAPRRVEELAHNLEALAEPSMSTARIEELRTFGIGVRAESQRFNTLLRQPTRDAAAAAREMLASEPAPDTELRAPAPTAARRSRTRLGRRRR